MLECTRDFSKTARLHRRLKSGARIDCSPRGQLARLYRRVQTKDSKPHQPRVYGHWTTPFGPPRSSRLEQMLDSATSLENCGGFHDSLATLSLSLSLLSASRFLVTRQSFLFLVSRVFDKRSRDRRAGDLNCRWVYLLHSSCVRCRAIRWLYLTSLLDCKCVVFWLDDSFVSDRFFCGEFVDFSRFCFWVKLSFYYSSCSCCDHEWQGIVSKGSERFRSKSWHRD